MRTDNPVKEALRAGQTCFGCFVPLPSPETIEILALSGFDFVLLDGEHGRVSPDDAYAMILAAEARGVQPMARIGQNDRQVILKYLDLGVTGVVIPQTTTADDARRALAAMRYSPRGTRGLAGGRTFDFGMGTPMADAVPVIDERLLTMVQFEHIDSLPHLEEILALPELDVLFVGPTDLALSMGHPGSPNHPDVDAVVERVCAAARGGRVALATVAPDAATARKRIGQGFRMIVANAPSLLAAASRSYLADARPS
jgi:4-hydroxy-2-oxoheptanedioate aldolase